MFRLLVRFPRPESRLRRPLDLVTPDRATLRTQSSALPPAVRVQLCARSVVW